MCVTTLFSKISATKIRIARTRDGDSYILAYQNDVIAEDDFRAVGLKPVRL